MLARSDVRLAYLLIFCIVAASFLLTPNLSAFVQFNLGYPRTSIPGLYAVAGGVTIVTMRLVGRLVDRHGAFGIGSVAALGFMAVVVAYLVLPEARLPVALGFVVLLVSLTSRNIAVRTLTTQVPGPHERARFLSLQSSVHHSAAAMGATLSALLLGTAASGALLGMPRLGLMAIALTLAVPPLLWVLQGKVDARGEG
jgi:predicted MFS family arabinose efflux permease